MEPGSYILYYCVSPAFGDSARSRGSISSLACLPRADVESYGVLENSRVMNLFKPLPLMRRVAPTPLLKVEGFNLKQPI